LKSFLGMSSRTRRSCLMKKPESKNLVTLSLQCIAFDVQTLQQYVPKVGRQSIPRLPSCLLNPF
jgi:hypothetical protein